MGAMTSTQVLATELETVDPKLPLMYERDDTFYSFIAKREAKVVSEKSMRIPLNLRPGGKFSQFSSSGGDLGRGAGTTYGEATIPVFDFKYAKEWHLRVDWATDDRRKAVVNVVRKEIAEAMSEFRSHSDSLALTGGDGVLATVSSVTTASGVDTVVLDQEYGAKLLRYGQDVNVYDTTLATQRTSAQEREITYKDDTNRTIKFSAVTGIVATDKIVLGGLTGASPASLYGLLYHASSASTGTWLGMARADYPEIRANRVNAGGGALALSHGRLALNAIGDRLGNSAKNTVVAWMHPAQAAAYEELGMLVTTINKDQNKSLDLYFNDNMRIAGAPIKQSHKWSKKRIDFIDSSAWGRAEMKAPGFLTIDGSKIFPVRGASGGLAASLLTYIVASWNMYCDRPNTISYIDGLAIPSGY